MDKACKQTDRILDDLQRNLITLYTKTNRKIQREVNLLIEIIYLDNEEATQSQRLKHANKNGMLNKIVETITEYTIKSNINAIDLINNNLENIYSINYAFMVEDIKRKTGVDIEND